MSSGNNLMRSEAAERAKLLSKVSYEVALDLTGDGDTYRSVTTARFDCSSPGASSFIDLVAERVPSAELNGEKLPASAFGAGRIQLSQLEAHNVLVVEADCDYMQTGVGMHRFTDPVDGNVYLHTQFEPFDAHRVYACFDQPDLKAPFDLSVRAPEAWEVISNGAVVSRSGGAWTFARTPPVSTYITAVVAGPYQVVRHRHGRFDLGVYVRESLMQYLDSDDIFEVTGQGLDFFESLFGYPYAFGDKYDQLFVPEFNFGAMENSACVTFNESMVFRGHITEAAREQRAGVILHEMAHMWFGDLVTMRWWDDLWLNESFATYMASHATDKATRFEGAWARFAFGTKTGAYAQDQLPSTHPISADIVDTDATHTHFDGITYSKGASVLRQLVAWVGEDAFTAGIRNYFRRHAWGNATLADFLAALEETSGRDLREWSREWLETAGVNALRPVVKVAGDAYESVVIEQTAPSDHPALRSHRLAVGVFEKGDAGLRRRGSAELDVVGPSTVVAELAGQRVADLLLPNDRDLAYAKVRLDDRSLDTLLAHLSELDDQLARALCWAALWDMVRDAELPTRRFVAITAQHVHREPDLAVVERLLRQAASAVDFYGDPSNRGAARTMLAERAKGSLDSAPPGSDAQNIWARNWILLADAEPDVASVRGLLDGSQSIEGFDVDTEIRWTIVGSLIARGLADAGLADAEVERDPTDIGRRRALAARASRPLASAKAEAWSAVLEDESLPLATIRAICSGFHQPMQEELLRAYVQPYFDIVPAVWARREMDVALSITGGLFPQFPIEQATVEAAEKATASDTPPAARRIIAEEIDQLRRELRARAADTA